MGRKAKFSKEIKLKAIMDYQEGKESIDQIAARLRCDKKSFKVWINNIQSMGESAFDEIPRNQSYSRKLKLAVINNYLNGNGSLLDISKKYKIYSKTTLRGWIKKYNGHIEIKDYE